MTARKPRTPKRPAVPRRRADVIDFPWRRTRAAAELVDGGPVPRTRATSAIVIVLPVVRLEAYSDG